MILEALRKVRYVVMSDIDQPAMTYYRDELPAVQAHLERYFRIPAELLARRRALAGRARAGPGPRRDGHRSDRTGGRCAPVSARPLGQRSSMAPASRIASRPSTTAGRSASSWAPGRRARLRARGCRPAPCSRPTSACGSSSGSRTSYRLPPVPWYASRSAATESSPRSQRRRSSRREVDFRRWTPLEADLSAWAGQRVTLRIELVTTQSPGEGHLGYVGSPRIAVKRP